MADFDRITLDPWGSVTIEDYSKLFDEFGIEEFEPLLSRIPEPHSLMRRRVIFGQRDYGRVVSAINEDEPFAVMSGFVPSGSPHLGHKMVMEEIIWHQRMGGDAFLCIADMEGYSARGISLEEGRRVGRDYLLSAIALGLEPEGAHVYYQSEDYLVRDLAYEIASEINFSMVRAIYGFTGETSIGHMLAPAIQTADILQPQLREFDGPKPVVIPVGADQDPHIRLARDAAARVNLFKLEVREDHGESYISIRAKRAREEAVEALGERLAREYGDDRVTTHALHADLDVSLDQMTRVQRIVREVEYEHGGHAFQPPAAIYHRFMGGLTGGKMSSSVPESFIGLKDDPEDAAAKARSAITGGGQTLAEHRELGGEPQRCSVYDLLLFHLVDDDHLLQEMYEGCLGGEQMCGDCKALAAELVKEFLVEHQEKREMAAERLHEYGL